MRTHLGCTGTAELGALSHETQRRLEQVEASWLEFSPNPPSLVVRHVQPDDVLALREIAGELLEFLSDIPDRERAGIPGGAFYYQDEQSGQYVRLKLWKGGLLTISWARPDYSHVKWECYRGEAVSLVFEPYQCLNGRLGFEAAPGAAHEIRAVLERCSGEYSQGECEITPEGNRLEIRLRDVNVSVLPFIQTLAAVSKPGTLIGEINVSSFRPGDVQDYCRFALGAGEVWLARPCLWPDVAEVQPLVTPPLERAA